MINKKKLADIKDRYVDHDYLEDCDACEDVPDLIDTLSKALDVVEAAKECPIVINDAITKLYPEECSTKTRTQAAIRCGDNGGTLAYFVRARQTIERALAPFSDDICGVKVKTDPTLKPDEWRIDK